MMKKNIISILIILSLVSAQSVSKTGTTAGQFLKIGVGARALAMGGAFSALSDDATGSYWNPAGLVHANDFSVIFDHTDWFLDISHEYVSTAANIPRLGVVGLSLSYLHMDEMLVTTTRDPEGESGQTFKAGAYSGQISFARSLTDRFSLGANVKLINEFIYNSSAAGFAVDLGTFYKTPVEGLNMGMSISNFGPKMKMNGRDLLKQTDLDPTVFSDPEHLNAFLETGEYDLPLIFRFGLAYTQKFLNDKAGLTIAADAMHPNDNTESINLGSELHFNKLVFLRAGYQHLGQRDSQQKLSFGGGLNIRYHNFRLKLDYAFLTYEKLGNPQKISVSFTNNF